MVVYGDCIGVEVKHYGRLLSTVFGRNSEMN